MTKRPPRTVRTARAVLAALLTAAAMAGAAPAPDPAGAVPASAPADATVHVLPAARGGGHERTQAALDTAVKAGVPGALARARDSHGTWNGSAGVADLYTKRPRLPGDRFRAGSITKPLIATVILQLEAEHRLSLDDTVEKWLPGMVQGHGNDGRRITLRHLLQQTSGLFDYTEDPGVLKNLTTTAFLEHRYDRWTPRRIVRTATAHPPNFAPGTRYAYTPTGYVLAALIMEKATGRSYEEEVERRIIAPLGLHSTRLPRHERTVPAPAGRSYSWFTDDPDRRMHDVTDFDPSLIRATGDLISSPEDLDRFLTALLQGGLLPPAQQRELKTTVPTGEDSGAAYGLGLFRFTLCGTEVWGHTGLFVGTQSVAFVSADTRHSLVFNFNTDTLSDTDAAGDVFKAEFCPGSK
ncbi:serine hydrolase domain-containing protein [Streptomyces hiroshimensis]|uniref:D-alanyl-D-alanine carboxypeptidase n=1 Tax=Streptomyces hiroshimensis TaxID=66424 RepID=A0ABQ2YNB3_9ACTN|nr:serine hydrolase domain-containing protein [Streptomyces hiroshimensis]GGX88403.1 D-alanyl-D-alanine carboxypeptidase [Streptomyces hiroshimensis]